ncbi:MAG: hypothetical protein P4M09_25600 [Devosia sp.]|nr:hypothetical protein [Devosia sp.]
MRSAAYLGLLAVLAAALPTLAVGQQGPAAAAGSGAATLAPSFTIWDVKLGQPVSTIPDADIVNVSCGTNGGPPALALKTFLDFAKCTPEASGLREVHFEYDDEQAYVAKALELEYRFLQAGTSVYAHPVNLSVLVDDKGIARGIRIITDNRASIRDRRSAAGLEQNLRARFNTWPLNCTKLPPIDGEESLGATFVHDVCTATDAQSGERLRIEARYMRRKGQVGIDPDTQKLLRDNFDSSTRFELVQAPYQPAEPPQQALPPDAAPASNG